MTGVTVIGVWLIWLGVLHRPPVFEAPVPAFFFGVLIERSEPLRPFSPIRPTGLTSLVCPAHWYIEACPGEHPEDQEPAN